MQTLIEIREEIRKKGINELSLVGTQNDLSLALDRINTIKENMNLEKARAIKEIDDKYREEIKALEADYAVMLKLMA